MNTTRVLNLFLVQWMNSRLARAVRKVIVHEQLGVP